MPMTCPHNSAVSCANCSLGSICLPLALAEDEVVKLEQIVHRGRPLQKNELLYHQADKFRSVFAVRSGAVKTFSISNSGEEQVTGFYLSGEIFGMDGISNNQYTGSAIALDTAAVCEIPFDQFENLTVQLPSLQRHFFQVMSKGIADDQKLLTLIKKNSADERVASMLLSLSARYKRRNQSAESFLLPMSRADMGNFLGLTIETVSRVFSRLKKNAVLETEGKYVKIINLDSLYEVAGIEQS